MQQAKYSSEMQNIGSSKKSIRKKLTKSFIMIITLMIISSVISLISLLKITSDYAKAVEDYGFAQGYIGELGIEFNGMVSTLKDAIIETDIQKIDNINKSIGVSFKNMRELLVLIEDTCTTERDKEILSETYKILSTYEPVITEVIGYTSKGNKLDAYELVMKKGEQLSNNIKNLIQEWLTINITNSNNLVSSSNLLKYILVGIVIVIVGVACIVSIHIAKKLARNICGPLADLMTVAGEMAKGNFDVIISCDTDDETKELSDTFQSMKDTIKSYIHEISEVTKEVAASNLTVSIKKEFKGNFIEIKTAINHIIDVLNNELTMISNASDEVAEGSKQVADGSQSLAEGATESAGVIEELSATVTEVSGKVLHNAENAQKAGKAAVNVQEIVDKGNQEMKEMIAAMEEINHRTDEIQTIAKTIEMISTRTNLLALNASIEAARAGDSGRGFAVVASEIGGLAEQSAKATKATIELVKKCISATEIGTQKVNITAEALSEIVVGAKEANTLVQEITKASEEQARSLDEIVRGIDHVSEVIQSNAAVSQQSAAASEELLSQASVLKDSVAQFHLR